MGLNGATCSSPSQLLISNGLQFTCRKQLLILSHRTIVNEGAAASPKQPIVNMGQGFFGYNPPQFIIDAAKEALNKVDCNQYSPTKGRPRLKKAIADSYSPLWGRQLNPETEVTITTGANEGKKPALS
jgi:aspartate/methionine/tyrosine aminotransferase